MALHHPLLPSQLYHRCDPNQFSFATTAELSEFKQMLGQDRAVDAIRFGVEVEHNGYNLFVLGPPGTGRHSFVKQVLTQKAASKTAPLDLCYVNNFETPQKPIAIQLPAGIAHQFEQDMAQLIDDLFSVLPEAFDGEIYRNQRHEIEKKVKQEQRQAFEQIRQHARDRGVDIEETATGFLFIPLKDGKALPIEEYKALSASERSQLDRKTEPLEQELRDMLQDLPRKNREVRKALDQLEHDVAKFATGELFQDLNYKYQDFSKITTYLESCQNDITDNLDLFISPEKEHSNPILQLFGNSSVEDELFDSTASSRYSVNILVDHRESTGAPIIYEDSPTYSDLLGRIEHISQIGALVTDFTLIRAGAFHQANGGYLILDAHKVLTEPFSWETLKRVLKAGEIKIKSLAQDYSFVSTVSLEPEPISLDLKVILIGDRHLYYLLQAYDPEFSELFKIAADFEDRMERSDDNVQKLAQLMGTLAQRDQLMPLDRTGIARLIEVGARYAGDSGQLSTQINKLADVVREAHYWAKSTNQQVIDAAAIQQAIDQQIYRVSRIRDDLRHEILNNTIFIDTTGEKIGQVNGLAVFQLGDYPFAHPTRITTRLSLGSGKVIDIEREVDLGGPIHSKGVLILSNFLASQYLTDQPLSLSASLVFEQSYGGIDGDSASAAELCVLLSAIAKLPIQQSFAVTGSINQHGQIQAIGAVNEKIEGFFDICQARGLTGKQGVIIPASNVKHLMLRHDVITAVSNQQFQIYAVETIDQCMELLIGTEAGHRDAAGQFPDGSINQQIVLGLQEFAQKRRDFLHPSEADESNKSGQEPDQ